MIRENIKADEIDRDQKDVCAVCLDEVQNRSTTDVCKHSFCFACIIEWSKIKRICPLCKQEFTLIVYDIKNMNNYSLLCLWLVKVERGVNVDRLIAGLIKMFSLMDTLANNGQYHLDKYNALMNRTVSVRARIDEFIRTHRSAVESLAPVLEHCDRTTKTVESILCLINRLLFGSRKGLEKISKILEEEVGIMVIELGELNRLTTERRHSVQMRSHIMNRLEWVAGNVHSILSRYHALSQSSHYNFKCQNAEYIQIMSETVRLEQSFERFAANYECVNEP